MLPFIQFAAIQKLSVVKRIRENKFDTVFVESEAAVAFDAAVE
jgi:hypothetical protein